MTSTVISRWAEPLAKVCLKNSSVGGAVLARTSIAGIDIDVYDRKNIVRRAARYDVVVLVGTETSSINRIELYERLGVKTIYYPYRVSDAPLLQPFLGLIGLLYEESRGRAVLVEQELEDALIPAALLIAVKGYPLRDAIEEVHEMGFSIFTPLESRLLVLMDTMRREGISLISEALEFKKEAFSGGDAHLSSVMEFTIEHYYHLRGLIPASLPRLYESLKVGGSYSKKLSDHERLLVSLSSELDYFMSGAVRNIALVLGENMEVYMGCNLLLREDACWPEADRATPLYERLAKSLGLERTSIYMSSPEDVACISYGFLEPDICRREDE